VQAIIKAIEYHLPEQVLTNHQLAAEFEDWTAERIEEKTGIAERRIAANEECSSDLGVAAAQKLFASGVCQPNDIDYLLLCTQSPDYFLPATACVMQHRLGLSSATGALDFNLGCSGFIYGLGLAKGLIETGQAHSVLLITAETYSKFIHPMDKSVRTIFGDAATATLIQSHNNSGIDSSPWIGPFVFGTDGKGAPNLIVPFGGMRDRFHKEVEQPSGNNLSMNGPEIFTFTLRVVPASVKELLLKAQKSLDEIDLFIFHQANQYILEHLRKKMNIPMGKFYIAMRHCGNTVSSTIPIALKHAFMENRLKNGQYIMLVGFGVGYSWGATLIRWGI
jgi:3-oxoacyl-[acyl-carrier-protein] synthase III